MGMDNLSKNIINYLSRFKSQTSSKQHFIFYYLYIINNEDELIHFLSEANKNLRQTVVGTVSNESINISESLLYKFCGIDKFINICKSSAQKAYENGEIEHCIILYILCGDFNLSAQICIKLLSSHITDKPFNHSKQFIVNLAKQLFNLAKHNHFHSISLINKALIKNINANNSFNMICAIHFAEFYDLFYQQQSNKCDKYQEALKIINTNGMIPINDENIIKLENNQNINSIIAPYKNKVLKLENDLKKYVGEICVAVMQILLLQFQTFQNNKQLKNAYRVSQKCYIIYNFFNNLESQIKPIGAGDTAKQISNLYFQTRCR